MKRRTLMVSLAAGAALAGQAFSRPVAPSITFNDAVEIVRHEMERHGLAATHEASALYAGVDKQSEGAAFAAILRPRETAARGSTRTGGQPRLKLLIQEDGRTTLQPIISAKMRKARG
ncbi:MAG: hypothetical protein V4710_02750 [Verrucomicrobiota bacterium]